MICSTVVGWQDQPAEAPYGQFHGMHKACFVLAHIPGRVPQLLPNLRVCVGLHVTCLVNNALQVPLMPRIAEAGCAQKSMLCACLQVCMS